MSPEHGPRICPECRRRTAEITCPTDGFATVEVAGVDVDPEALVGEVFEGRYRVDALLGEGGMGAVYRATQLPMERPVALKVLHRSLSRDLKAIARFQREARAIAALRHPNTIRMVDFGQTSAGRLFLVTELLVGEPLDECMRREGPQPASRVVAICRQILEALAEAHAAGIVHRDLKPANLFLVDLPGRPDHVKVLDFGIAKLDPASGEATLTETGALVGTPLYMSPEQVQAQPVSPQTDLYALGVLAYQLLTGTTPYPAAGLQELMIAHALEPPRPLTVRGQLLEGPLVDLVLACLAKSPDHRPAGALGALVRLDPEVGASGWVRPARHALLGAATDADGPGPALPPASLSTGHAAPSPPSRRGRVAALVAAVALAWVAVGAAWWLWPSDGPPAAEPAAPPPSEPVAAEPAPPPEPEASAVEPTAEPAEPPTVVLSIVSTPPGAAVRVAGEDAGVTPALLRRPRADEPLAVELTLEGHAPASFSVTPSEDRLVERTLSPVAVAKPPRPKRSPAAAAKPPPPPPKPKPKPKTDLEVLLGD